MLSPGAGLEGSLTHVTEVMTKIQKDRLIYGQTNRKIHKHTDTHTETQKHTQSHRQTYKKEDREDRHLNRQMRLKTLDFVPSC